MDEHDVEAKIAADFRKEGLVRKTCPTCLYHLWLCPGVTQTCPVCGATFEED